MQKIYKVLFTAHIQTVTLALKFPCVVSITWRRGTSLIIQARKFQKSNKDDKSKKELSLSTKLYNYSAIWQSIPKQASSNRKKYCLIYTDTLYSVNF